MKSTLQQAIDNGKFTIEYDESTGIMAVTGYRTHFDIVKKPSKKYSSAKQGKLKYKTNSK